MNSSVHRFRVQRASQFDGSEAESSRRGSSPDLTPRRRRPAIPACDRCRRFKKKCSRTFPSCTLCAATGHGCSLATAASSNDAQVHHLRARIAWLSQHVNASRPAGQAPVESVPTGANLPTSQTNTPAVLSPNSTSPSAVAFPARHAEVQHVETRPQASHVSTQRAPPTHSPTSPLSPLPPDGLAQRLVDAYFRNVNRAYPFVDRARVLHDLETAADDAASPSSPSSPNAPSGANATLLYLIMAIGCTTLQRAGQIAPDVAGKFHVDYAAIVQECFGFGHAEALVSVQILVLLALYSLFDPDSASAWSIGSIVGVVARQAILLGLSRRLPLEAPSTQQGPAVELRYRLFWSIYILDRMMAASLGLPVAMVDDNMDVPLPSLTIDEFAAPSIPERARAASVLQTSRHVIQLRQLEDRILREVHTRKHADVRSLAATDRAAVLSGLRGGIEDWYASGCLLAPLDLDTEAVPDNVPIHSSMTWLSARYYHLLLLLYYPSSFSRYSGGSNPTSVISRPELQRFAQKHLQATATLHQQRQLPLNRITLCRLLPVGLVLMHCFLAEADSGHPFGAADAIAILVSIAESFPAAWTQAQQAAHILRRFQAVAAANMATDDRSLLYDPSYFVRQTAPYSLAGTSTRALMQPLLAAMGTLMQETLGRTSFYLFTELEERSDKLDRDRERETPVRHQPQQPLSLPQVVPSVQSVNSVQSVLAANNAGWGLELDFL
ncbi:Rac GTPase-activating protein BCR/ABR [Sporothrix bragantina]|uniref:Rac GTPase-activating protein BCR/ABR n=1 Tax=Sporothrix bragantina TaxID=671064 RepID=A0ABP0BQZ5_9PEZI